MIPTVLQQCLGEQVASQTDSIADEIRKRKIEKFVLLGTGSSYFATIAEKYFFDAMTSFWSFPYVSSVFKSYPPKFLDEKTAVFFHSHSGKTEGDDAVVKFSQSKGAFTVGVTDIENSPLTSVVDQVFIGPGGPKHEMPASRTYATALFRMMLLGLKLSTIAEDAAAWQALDNSMKRMPAQVGEFMRQYESAAGENVNRLKDVTSFFCIGSGPNLSTADECALALSQCAGVPSQSFEADNFVHGPLQTLKKSMGFVGIAAPAPCKIGF
jgi:Predicted phosphosugar isomerases